MSLLEEDISDIIKASYIDWVKLHNKIVLITGATGLVGTAIITVLYYANRMLNLDLSVIALVRNAEKAQKRFEGISGNGFLSFVVGTVESFDFSTEPVSVDYLIHCASQTSSKGFVECAVETIDTAVTGTKRMLEFAKLSHIKGFVCLSSMEVYGYPHRGQKVTEEEFGAFSPLVLRNSYPISKILCENMCIAYVDEYGLPAKICRLTQVIDSKNDETDNRIVAYFSRCVINKENIVLKTAGETERSYVYDLDAVSAILTVLLEGKSGEAYNVANKDTYCSIAQMAEHIANAYGLTVEYDIQSSANTGYLNTLYMDLDTTKITDLGWTPKFGIDEAYKRLTTNMSQYC